VKLNNQKKYRIVFGLYLIAILAASSIPGRSMPKIIILSPDKLLHLTEYFILAVLAYLSFKKFSKTLIIGLILFAIMDEIWQSFIPGRWPSVFDVVADILGMMIVITTVYFRSLKDHD
jgi:VanZ family protein